MGRMQAFREVAVSTPLGEDVLLLRSMSGREEMGRLFTYDLDLLSEDGEIDFAEILGKNITVRVENLARETRHFNGYVNRFMQTGSLGRLVKYRATMVPWLWFLTRTADCRIFQNMSVPEIIEQVFRDYGFTDFERRLGGSYGVWEYCVQYRETAFQFISRLMEQEGMYYYFVHENGKHVLVFSDGPNSHEPFGGYETIRYMEHGDAVAGEEYIHDWVNEKSVCSGAYALNDFDFTSPSKSLNASSQITRPHDGSELEIFDYPGEYAEYDEGERYARTRIEELQVRHERVDGKANARGVSPGCTFELTDYARADQCRKHLVVAADYHVESDDFDGAGEPVGRGPTFECRFSAMSSAETFRAARSTPAPRIRGPQTAMVVGPSGEEIHTDEYGRVKVQFHWDRYGKSDENSSCWVRVAQVWAGKKWGAMYIPRIGQEVVVEFLEGDPDRPLVTGRVYNGGAKPPYDLPANKTMSTLKSNSSKGGAGFNEIRFEDKKGSEEFFVHAEKDQNIVVKNDKSEQVGHDEMLRVENDRSREVGRNESVSIGEDLQMDVGSDQTITVGNISILQAENQIQLQVGKACISMTKDGTIVIDGADIYVSGKNIQVTGEKNYSYVADAVSVTARSSHQIKGAVVKHNC